MDLTVPNIASSADCRVKKPDGPRVVIDACLHGFSQKVATTEAAAGNRQQK